MAFLLLNVFVLGGCVVLLFVSGPSGPLILLTLGTLAMAVSKIAAEFAREKTSVHGKRSGPEESAAANTARPQR